MRRIIDWKKPRTCEVIYKSLTRKAYLVKWFGETKKSMLKFDDFKRRQHNKESRYQMREKTKDGVWRLVEG